MKIGFFLDIYEPYISGMVESAKTLKEALEEQGHKVYIITTNENSKVKHYIKNKNIIKIPSTKTNINNFSLRITYPKKAEKIIEKLKLDIIHSHTEWTIGRFGKKMAQKLNIPFIQTFHTVYEGSIDYVTKGHFTKITKLITKKIISSYYNDNIIDEIIVPTDKIKQLLTKTYKINKPISVIPTGINVNNFNKNINIEKLKEKLNIKKEDFIISCAGRLGYEKNINFLVESHIKLAEKNKNIKLLLIGDGPLKEELEELVKQNNKENNIIFIGQVPHKEIYNYYHLSNIFTSASKYETQGLTLLESLACQTPVLCINNEVFKTVIKHKYNGLIFKNKNEYIKQVLLLEKNKEFLNKLKENTLESIKEYSYTKFSNKVLNVYNKYLKENTSKKNE